MLEKDVMLRPQTMASVQRALETAMPMTRIGPLLPEAGELPSLSLAMPIGSSRAGTPANEGTFSVITTHTTLPSKPLWLAIGTALLALAMVVGRLSAG